MNRRTVRPNRDHHAAAAGPVSSPSVTGDPGGQSRITRFLIMHPAGPLLAGLLTGILPLAWGDDPTARQSLVTTPILALLAGALLVWSWRRPAWRGEVAKFAGGFAWGVLSTWLALHPGPDHLHRQLPVTPCGMEMEVVVTEPTAAPGAPEWLPNPALLRARVRRLRFTPEEAWRSVRGTVALRLPRNSPRIGFGDVLLVRGTSSLPATPDLPGEFNFRRHLLAQDVWRVVHAKDDIILRPPPSPMLRLARVGLDLRDHLLTRLTASYHDQDSRRLLAALLFGCRQGISWRDQQAYRASGTIHIFAISGLHVGMVAVALLLFLRPVPFRWRHLLAPLVLTGYVLTTGFQPAAVRALLMISLWLVARASLRPTSSLNAVFLAAALTLVVRPLACLGTGFQFSFTVTGFLVLAWHSGHTWSKLVNERGRWLPSRLRTRASRAAANCRRWLAGGVFTCLVAWLASLGINVAVHGCFVPAAPLVNLAILPPLSALFITVFGQILFLPIPWLANAVGAIVTTLLDIIRFIGAHGNGRFWLPPHTAVLAIYYLALIALVTARQRRGFLLATTALLGMMLAWHVRDCLRPPAVLVLHGGDSQSPCVMLCPGGGRPPLTVNAPGGDDVAAWRNLLLAEGIDEVDTLLLPGVRREHAAGAARALATTRVHRLLLPANWRIGAYARNAVQAAAGSDTPINTIAVNRHAAPPLRHLETGLSFQADDGHHWQLTWADATTTVTIACQELLPGWRQMTIRAPGEPPRVLDFHHQNQRRLVRHLPPSR